MKKLVTVLAVLVLVVLAAMATGLKVIDFLEIVLFLAGAVMLLLLPVAGVVFLIDWAWDHNPNPFYSVFATVISFLASYCLFIYFWLPLVHKYLLHK